MIKLNTKTRHRYYIRNTKISGVISNNAGAYALKRAENERIPAFCISPKSYESRGEFNQAFLAKLKELNPDLIVLAGFLVILPEEMTEIYQYSSFPDSLFLRNGFLRIEGS